MPVTFRRFKVAKALTLPEKLNNYDAFYVNRVNIVWVSNGKSSSTAKILIEGNGIKLFGARKFAPTQL